MDLPSLDTSSRSFRFQGQRLLLTYREHLDKQKLVEFIKTASGIRQLAFARAAHEAGSDEATPYEHTHVLVDFGKSWQCKNCRRLDFSVEDGVIHPNWQPIKSASHFANARKYIGKEDPENADLLDAPKSICATIWAQPTLGDALLACARTPGDVSGVIAAYAARPAIEVRIERPSHPWQMQVLDLVAEEPDRRSVHWFYDPVGNTGKTWLARYLLANKLAYMVKQCGGSYHFATVMANAIASGWDQRCIVFDLPRSAEEHAIYSSIEEVKDGVVTALKYQGGTLLFNQPHVLVFANFRPKLSAISLDRWQIHEICHKSLTLETALVASCKPPSTPPPPREDNLSDADIKEVLADFLEVTKSMTK